MTGFNSLLFLFLFLPLFMALFHLTGRSGKLVTGIVASLLFYAWGNLVFLPLMLGLIIINFCIGRHLAASVAASRT
jgi:alginate O-acetyltransferase complex protein AlgI